MIGHLGARISALLDGQLSAEETERAWAHVSTCHFCRDRVEREGWVKTRLAGLSMGTGSASADLKGSLRGMPPGDYLAYAVHADTPPRTRRNLGLAALGGSAVGAAVVGVLALGAAPADAPNVDRRAPVTNLVTPGPSPASTPARRTLP